MEIYQEIAFIQASRRKCMEYNNMEWLEKHTENIKRIIEYLPSGSGLDNGTTFDYENSNGEKLIFYTAYHVMNELGYYTHWIDPITIVITPSLCFNFIITIRGNFGKDQDIKDDICDRFNEFLRSEIK